VIKPKFIVVLGIFISMLNLTTYQFVSQDDGLNPNWTVGVQVGSVRISKYIEFSENIAFCDERAGDIITDEVIFISENDVRLKRHAVGEKRNTSWEVPIVRDFYQFFAFPDPVESRCDHESPLTTTNTTLLRELFKNDQSTNITVENRNFTISNFKFHSLHNHYHNFNATYELDTGWLLKVDFQDVSVTGSIQGTVRLKILSIDGQDITSGNPTESLPLVGFEFLLIPLVALYLRKRK
jgi:hypothetical protein